jgi:hypothetical protein
MDKKQLQAMKRLAPKLSALRMTLRGQERIILDEMVKAYESEVSAHSASVGQKTPTKTPEVSMHSTAVGQKILGTKTPTKTPEVSLHSASVGQKTPTKTPTKTPQIEFQSSVGRIELDATTGVYRVTIL